VPLSITLHLHCAEGGSGVGGEEWVAGASGQDCHLAALKGLDGFPFGVVFADGIHVEGGEHAGLLPCRLQRRTECQRVDYGGEHTHLVAFHAVETFGCALHSAEYVAPAYHDGNLHTGGCGFLYLGGILAQSHRVDAVILCAHERFTAEFEQHTAVFCSHAERFFTKIALISRM